MASNLLGGNLLRQHGSNPHAQVRNHNFPSSSSSLYTSFVREDHALETGDQKLELIGSMILGGIFLGVWFLIKMVYYEILEENKRQSENQDTEEISIRTLL